MWQFTALEFGIFITLFIGERFSVFCDEKILIKLLNLGFFVVGGCALKYYHERRVRARLQEDLNALFSDYIPLDGEEEIEIEFGNPRSPSISTKKEQQRPLVR
jgi:hypothetical protein